MLIDEMGIRDKIEIKQVGIIFRDGSGQVDPASPHPEGKVPALIHDGTLITESGAILLYLTDLFPDVGLAPQPGNPRRGEYLTWLFWYQGVMEPVMLAEVMGIRHPALRATSAAWPRVWRGCARLWKRGRGWLARVRRRI